MQEFTSYFHHYLFLHFSPNQSILLTFKVLQEVNLYGEKVVLALFSSSAEYNICISNAQYYELSAQQNLWCEILEF